MTNDRNVFHKWHLVMHLEYDRIHYSPSSIGLPSIEKLQSSNGLIGAPR